MAIERERKFLLKSVPFLPANGRLAFVGYFSEPGKPAVRVSVTSHGQAKVCIKSVGGEEREEFEYSIPMEDAKKLINLAPFSITKLRFDLDGWEIDYIPSRRLWMAEWEESPGKDPIPSPLPDWIGEEVTGISYYTMQHLAWSHNENES